MYVYYYDNSFEGLLTAVFDVYARHERPDVLLPEGAPMPMFAEREHHVVSEQTKAERVWRGVLARTDRYVSDMLICVWLSEESGADELLLHYLCKIFDCPRGKTYDFNDTEILQARKIAQRVRQERERLIQFVRFRKMADGTYFAPVSPRHNALPLAVGHFRTRFADQKWVIYDIGRGYGYGYDLSRVVELTLDTSGMTPTGDLPEEQYAADDQLYGRLWKEYYNSMSIAERRNPTLRRRNMPVRYWPFMTEFK